MGLDDESPEEFPEDTGSHGAGATPGPVEHTYTGHAWSEVIYGTSENDKITGGGGTDELYGLGGDDRLFGEAGDDRLYAGTGENILVGGTGADQFFLAGDFQSGVTTIYCGDNGGPDDGARDLIALTGSGAVYVYGFNPDQDMFAVFGSATTGGWVPDSNWSVYTLANNLTLYLIGVNASALDDSNWEVHTGTY